MNIGEESEKLKNLICFGNDGWNRELKEDLLKFLLLMNRFENYLYKQGVSSPKLGELHKELIKEEWFDIHRYDDFPNFFAERYVNNHLGGSRLKQLITSKTSTKDKEIKAVLEEHLKGNREPKFILTYLEIATNFRNNLFHGSKSAYELPQYLDCFLCINEFLYVLLQDMLENGFIRNDRKFPRDESIRQNMQSISAKKDGIREGRKMAKEKIAQKMIENGYELQVIANITELNLEDILVLKR